MNFIEISLLLFFILSLVLLISVKVLFLFASKRKWKELTVDLSRESKKLDQDQSPKIRENMNEMEREEKKTEAQKPLVWILKELMKNFKKDKVPDVGAQTTYYLILALFPFLIFLLSVLQYTSLEYQQIIATLEHVLPQQAHDLIFGTIEEVFTGGSGALLSIGMITTLWSSLKGANALIKGVNVAYNVEETRHFIKVRLIALLTTVGIPIVMIFTFFFIVLGEFIGTYIFGFLGLSSYFIQVWGIIRFPIPVIVMVLFFMAFYKYAPNKTLGFSEVFWGAISTVVLWLIASLGFAFYVNNFSNYSNVYGSIGSIIVVLLWLYLSSIIIIIGGEINVVLSQYRREINKKRSTPLP